MHYEVVSTINPTSEIWKNQKERILLKQGQVLSISPSPNFNQLKLQENVQGYNLIDQLTKRKYNSKASLFFDQVPTVTKAEIFMNEGWTISINHDGEEIGHMALYPDTRRLVRAVSYLNQDGTTDFVEEYADDGAVFSNIFYANNQAEQIDFFNDEQLPVLSYFFYEGQNNFVVQRDPETLTVCETYSNAIDCMANQLKKQVESTDTIGISYMGIELSVLKDTISRNTLYLEESPLDNSGNVKLNLADILENRIPFIQEVQMSTNYYEQLTLKNISLDKIVINDE